MGVLPENKTHVLKTRVFLGTMKPTFRGGMNGGSNLFILFRKAQAQLWFFFNSGFFLHQKNDLINKSVFFQLGLFLHQKQKTRFFLIMWDPLIYYALMGSVPEGPEFSFD